MSITIVLVVFAVVLFFEMAFILLQKSKRDKIQQKLMELFLSGKFKEFDEYVNSQEVIRNVPPYNREYIKMNAAIAQNSDKKIEKALETILKVKMNDIQKEEVYLNGFHYYIDKEDKNKANAYRKLLLDITKSEEQKVYVERLFDIKINKSSVYLDEMLKEVECLPKSKKATAYLMISEMYKNANMEALSKSYKEKYINENQGS